MADDEMDGLEGLDDFGDDSDFGDQLDNFMESDIGEDGGMESDSELDSFFEDLSTIDDLEVQEDEAEEAPAEEPDVDMEEEPEAEEPVEDYREEPVEEEKKPLLVPAIIFSVVGMLLGVIGVVVMYFLNKPVEVPIQPPPPVVEAPQPLPPPPPVVVYREPEPVQPPPPPPPPIKTTKFFVQVANCIYKECIDDYRFLLKRYGYPTKVSSSTEATPMTEVVSRQTLGEEEASKWVKRINRENHLTGQAYRKKTGQRYRISLGLFPDLDTANRVKAHLNQIYAAQIFFEAHHAEQRINYHKIRTGGFESRQEAVQLQKFLLQKDKRFNGAFVISQLD